MPSRVLGRTGRPVSVISLGTWQLGADWGEVRPAAQAVLEAAVQAGVTMFDTADVYGDGRSEQCIAEFLAAHPGLDMFVATKMGRRADQSRETTPWRTSAPGPTARGRTSHRHPRPRAVHCPRGDQQRPGVRRPRHARGGGDGPGVMGAYGVSVETTDQALAAISRPSVALGPDHQQRIPGQAARTGPARALKQGWASSRGSRWRAASCRGDTTSRPPSPMTTTGRTTGTGRPSTGVRPLRCRLA